MLFSFYLYPSYICYVLVELRQSIATTFSRTKSIQTNLAQTHVWSDSCSKHMRAQCVRARQLYVARLCASQLFDRCVQEQRIFAPKQSGICVIFTQNVKQFTIISVFAGDSLNILCAKKKPPSQRSLIISFDCTFIGNSTTKYSGLTGKKSGKFIFVRF